MKNSHQNKGSIAIVLFIIILIIAGVIFVAYRVLGLGPTPRNNEEQLPVVEPEEEETPEVQGTTTYTNARYKFSLEYPKKFGPVKEYPDSTQACQSVTVDEVTRKQVTVAHMNNLAVTLVCHSLTDEIRMGGGEALAEYDGEITKDVKIDGKAVYEWQHTTPTGFTVTTIYIPLTIVTHLQVEHTYRNIEGYPAMSVSEWKALLASFKTTK
jgi:hypothetical protein